MDSTVLSNKGPICHRQQSSVYICLLNSVPAPVTSPWHLPQGALSPPVNQTQMTPLTPFLRFTTLIHYIPASYLCLPVYTQR